MNNDIHNIHTNASDDLCDFQREVSFEKMEIGWHKGWVKKTPCKLSTVCLTWWALQSQQDTGEEGSRKPKWLPAGDLSQYAYRFHLLID